MNRLWLIAALAIVGACVVDTAQAVSVREKQSNSVWRKQDDCAHAALLRFPDYTPESNAARARATRDCEIKSHVPPREPVVVSPVKKIPDADAN